MTSRAIASAALVAVLAGCSAHAEAPTGDPFVRVFRALRPAVVLFTMKIASNGPNHPGRFDDAYGSGIVVASDATGSDVLSVEHVVHGAFHLRVTLDERRVVPARVIAVDTKNDLALVRIDVPGRIVARLGRSRDVEPGTAVGIAGYPIPDAFSDEHLGVKTSVYAGRVSSQRSDSLELDLPVIPGESGGPVFDASTGIVIALGESRFDDEKAIGFGIPIEVAEQFLASRQIAFERAP